MEDKVKDAYRTSKNIYDGVLTQRSFLGRMYIKLFWGGVDDNEIAQKILGWIPDRFAGTILDVPVGTAVFTEEKWHSLTKAKITCLDYSDDMLVQARKRLKDSYHIECVQGDVGELPMNDNSFDIVLSMNGFHAFPEKEKAFAETWRVLKDGGVFIACFYIRGKSRLTDWLVKQILSKKGWFTPPFQTEEELKAVLEERYKDIELYVDGSMAYFKCVK